MMAAPRAIRHADDLRGRRAVVLGLARSGVAASRFLARQGAQVTAYDRRPASDICDAVAALAGHEVTLALGVDRSEAARLIAGADLLVTSPSVSSRFPTTEPWLRAALASAEAAGTELVSEVELFLRLTRSRVLAVTGTKGKTTTTALLGAILDAAGVPAMVGGNIGRPLIERVTDLGPHDWAVLELSELQLPTISRGADVALYTNVTEDHLDRHGSVAAYRAVKARLAELTAGRGTLVLNRDDAGCLQLGAGLPGAAIDWYGLEPDAGLAAGVDAGGWVTLDGSRLLPVADVRLPGRHMLSNVLGAAAAARRTGAGPRAIAAGIAAFEGVAHRLETVAWRAGVRWVNDSQATVPAATLAALEAFEAPIVLLAGGQGKGLSYDDLADAIAARCRGAVLLGETAAELESLIAGRVEVRRAASMTDAVRRAVELARPGDVALLSPAAASFDMFDDYAARGDAFRAAVADLEVEP